MKKHNIMFGFIKKIFITAMMFLGWDALKCVSMSDQECKVRPAIMNIYINEPVFYPYSVLGNICSGIRNDINNLYAKLCVSDVVEGMNVKVFKSNVKN